MNTKNKIDQKKCMLYTKEDLRLTLLYIVDKPHLYDSFNESYDYSEVTDMSHLFSYNIERGDNKVFSKFREMKSVPFLHTDNVTNMEGMYSGCKNLKEIPSTNTKKCLNFNHMTDGCVGLKNRTDMSFIFMDVLSLNNRFRENLIKRKFG